MKRAFLILSASALVSAIASAQAPAAMRGATIEAALRQKLERASGKPLLPIVMHGVRTAEIDYFEREDKIASETVAKVASITRLPEAKIPEPPRPGTNPAFANKMFMQELERAAGKPLSDGERVKVEEALAKHAKDQETNLDRYARDLTLKVPGLTKAEAREVLSGLAPKDEPPTEPKRPGRASRQEEPSPPRRGPAL